MKRRRGQANTEFMVMVALVAIATIGIVTLFGDNIRGLFGNSSDNLGGEETENDSRSSSAVATEKSMEDFAQNQVYDPNPAKMGGPPAGGKASKTGGPALQ